MTYLTTQEVADMLKFKDISSIHQMLHSGTLPKDLTIRIGRKRLFIQEKLEEFLKTKIGA